MGHQFVNADWSRLSPTNAVKARNHGFTNTPSATDSVTRDPEIMRSQA